MKRPNRMTSLSILAVSLSLASPLALATEDRPNGMKDRSSSAAARQNQSQSAVAKATSSSNSNQQVSQESTLASNVTISEGAFETNITIEDEAGAGGTPFSGGGGSADLTIDTTPSAPAIPVYPSGTCGTGWSLGASLTGGSGGFGKTKIDPECSAREVARLFYAFGEREKAIRILCAQPASDVLPGCEPFQDYNREMALLQMENSDLHGKIDALEEEDRKLHEADKRIFETSQTK